MESTVIKMRLVDYTVPSILGFRRTEDISSAIMLPLVRSFTLDLALMNSRHSELYLGQCCSLGWH